MIEQRKAIVWHSDCFSFFTQLKKLNFINYLFVWFLFIGLYSNLKSNHIMKQTLKNNLIVVSLYILAGFIFNGYLPYMLVVFLILSATVSYFLFRRKSKEETRKGLLRMHAPFLLILMVAALFLNNIRVVLPYLLFVPAVVYLVYCAIFSERKVLFFVGIIALSVISVATYNEISGTNEIFDVSYYSRFITQK